VNRHERRAKEAKGRQNGAPSTPNAPNVLTDLEKQELHALQDRAEQYAFELGQTRFQYLQREAQLAQQVARAIEAFQTRVAEIAAAHGGTAEAPLDLDLNTGAFTPQIAAALKP
jgi:hypothetical protein